MYTIDFTLTGATPLLMHADDVEQADILKEWRTDSQNKSLSVPGDDRSPAWTWQTYLYRGPENIAIPGANLSVGFRWAGAKMILQKNETYKKVTQNGMRFGEFLEFRTNGKEVPLASILAIRDEPFSKQAAAVKDLHFLLDVRRVRVGQAKHIRVRARFPSWTIRGSVDVLDAEVLKPDIMARLFTLAGTGGLSDWRPSAPSPGPFGMFEAEIRVRK